MSRTQFWIASSLACAAIAMMIANAVLFTGNRATQADINARAQYVQQSLQLEGLFNEMVRALAELSARNNDPQLKSLLERVGITFTVNAPAAQASTPKK